MEENALKESLAGLVAEITIPRGLQSDLDGREQATNAVKIETRSSQELLDHLRVSLKYVLFDLEATRRENGYLRKMIEQWA